MILVDTSIWIEFLRGRLHIPNSLADHAVTCGPVIQEVLQGVRAHARARAEKALLSMICVSDPLPAAVFTHAASLYREGRDRGVTIRSSIDCLIAAIAIENQVPVWHRDRDFDRIASFTSLRTAYKA